MGHWIIRLKGQGVRQNGRWIEVRPVSHFFGLKGGFAIQGTCEHFEMVGRESVRKEVLTSSTFLTFQRVDIQDLEMVRS